FGVGKASGSPAYSPFSYSLNTTYLIVVKYTFNTGSTTDDTASLFVNPALGGTEPSATISGVTDTATDLTAISALGLRQGTAGNMPTVKIDGIRVATSWSEAASSSTTYTITYNGNGNTGGSAPTDGTVYTSGATVTVLGAGNLTKNGNSFIGWNTAAD